jgi:hypothetical protein
MSDLVHDSRRLVPVQPVFNQPALRPVKGQTSLEFYCHCLQ